MTGILSAETDTYADLWGSVPQYAVNSPGAQYAQTFHQIVHDTGATVLDVGCGAGKGMLALKALGYHVAGVDITDAGLTGEAKSMPFFVDSAWHDLSPIPYLLSVGQGHPWTPDGVDYIYCCDVLEHIPPQFTMLAVARMLDVAKKAVVLTVWYREDVYGPWVGRPLHLTTQLFSWWKDSISEVGDLLEARDCQDFGLFVVRGRCAT